MMNKFKEALEEVDYEMSLHENEKVPLIITRKNAKTILFALKFLERVMGEPTDSQWEDIPRKIIQAYGVKINRTHKMKQYLSILFETLPDWLDEELDGDTNIASGDICVWVYKLMIEQAVKEVSDDKTNDRQHGGLDENK